MGILTTTLTLPGCAKKKSEPTLAQGQGVGLYQISAYNEKRFELQTLEPLPDLSTEAPTTRAQKLTVESAVSTDQDRINAFDPVQYRTDAELLGKDLKFRGRPNHKYEILYELSGNFLRVLKRASKEDLPYQELTYGEKESTGTYRIPLVGYKISGYFRLEEQDQGDERRILIEVPESDPQRATHFRINPLERILFEALTKTDVYPASYFEGEWHFAQTVTLTKESEQAKTELESAQEGVVNSAYRIKFLKEQNSLRGVDLNVDPRVSNANPLNFDTVISLPVTWKTYQVAQDGLQRGMKELEVSPKTLTESPLIAIDFEKTLVTTPNGENAKESSTFHAQKSVVDLRFAQDYFSVTLQDSASHRQTKYAFKRILPGNDYPVRRYFKSDNRLFGYFSTERVQIDNYQILRRDELEKNLFLTRFHPQRDIVYRFTNTTPQDPELRKLAEISINFWQRAFAEAGLPIRITLLNGSDGKDDVELGDLRYNTINMVRSYTYQDGYFGLGPSLKDPLTGEIISASVNLHENSIKAQFIEIIQNYVRRKLNRLEPGTSPLLSAPLAIDHKDYYDPVPMDRDNLSDKIESRCPEVVSWVTRPEAERSSELSLDLLESCATQIMREKILGTLTHEIGHNLGLQHNFKGSIDHDNFFLNPSEISSLYQLEVDPQDLPQSSSVMDYLDITDHSIYFPGKYDIAALKYGYLNQVEVQGAAQSARAIDPERELLAQISREELKRYHYCSDADLALDSDPLCAKLDTGTTPSEIALSLIMKYKRDILYSNSRWDRKDLPSGSTLSQRRVTRYFIPLKRIYDEWRFQLVSALSENDNYLTSFDESSYRRFLDGLLNSRDLNRSLEDYHLASRIVFHFFNDYVTQLPNRSCISRNAYGDLTAMELDELQAQLQLKSPIIRGCEDLSVQQHFTSRGWELLGLTGFPLTDVKFSRSLESQDDPIDLAGILNDRVNAYVYLAFRNDTQIHNHYKLHPNFLDEPDLRGKVMGSLMNRLLYGLNLSSLKNDDRFKSLDFKEPIAKFKGESRLLELATKYLFEGLDTPSHASASLARKSPFQTHMVSSIDETREASALYATPTGEYIIAKKFNTWAKKLIDKVNQIQRKLSYNQVDSEKLKMAATNAIEESTPPAGGATVGEMINWAIENRFFQKKLGPYAGPDLLAPEWSLYGDHDSLNKQLKYAQEIGNEYLVQRLQEELEEFRNSPLSEVGITDLNHEGLLARLAINLRTLEELQDPQGSDLYTELYEQRNLLLKVLSLFSER